MKDPRSDPAPGGSSSQGSGEAFAAATAAGKGESSGAAERKNQQKKNRASSPILRMKGRDVAVVDTTSAWTGEKKTKFQSTPTSGDLSMTARDDSEEADKIVIDINDEREQEWPEEIEGLDWDDAMLQEKINSYTKCYNGLPDDDDEEAWALSNDQQLNNMNNRLALCRIKAHRMLNGEELSDAELREMYPPSTLKEEGYFKWFERDFDWYFDPQYCQYAHLQDYQRLALPDTGEYIDWELYHNTCSTLESDQEYVQFWEKLSSKTKWIKNFLCTQSSERRRLEHVAYYHSVKIAHGFTNIFSALLCSAFTEYMCSVRFDYNLSKEDAYLYWEIWKLVAKQKMNFKDALFQVKDKDISYLCHHKVEAELDGDEWFWPGLIRRNYNTYVADINENFTDGEAYKLVMEAVKKFVPKPKSYYDYAKKKLDIAEKIGLIPPSHTKAQNGRTVCSSQVTE